MVCGSVCGEVEMTEEDSAAEKGVGGALFGMGAATDWTIEDVGVHSVVLGDAGEVTGHLDSKNHMVTCAKRARGVASGVVVRREVRSLCCDGGHRKKSLSRVLSSSWEVGAVFVVMKFEHLD